MNAVFLTTPELQARYLSACEPLIQSVIDRAVKGEFEASDVMGWIRSGKAVAGVVLEQDKPKLCMVFEFVFYPRKTCVNVLALGGSDLQACARDYLHYFLQWCAESGIAEIQAYTSPAMTRLLEPIGFKKTYDLVRLKC